MTLKAILPVPVGSIKQYIMKGYAINEKRLQALEKIIDIQSRMLADALDIEELLDS